MKVGLFFGTQHYPDSDMRRKFEEHMEQARVIRDCGYDSLMIAQHYLTHPDQFFQTTPMLARLAAETGDMQIGTNILVLPLHNVVDIAEQYATMDIISGGRLIMGIALGYREAEYEAFGVDKKTRAKRFDEQIEALKLLWEQDDATYEGRFVNFKNISIRPKPLQKPRPPIWIGAAGDPAVKRAALLGDAWLASSVPTVSAVKEQLVMYHKTRADAGLPPAQEFCKCVELYVAETREKAFAEGAPYIMNKYRAYFAWGMGKNVTGESGENLPLDQLVKDRFIVGSPEDCIRDCLQHRDELGVTHLQIRMNFPGMPSEQFIHNLRLFAKEVLPHIR